MSTLQQSHFGNSNRSSLYKVYAPYIKCMLHLAIIAASKNLLLTTKTEAHSVLEFCVDNLVALLK